MAIGIVSFAILSVLGTMSVGLSTVRDAKKETTSAQIAAQIGSGMSQTPFANLAAFATGGPYFFDDSGRKLDSLQSASFSARVEAVSTAYPGAPSDVLTTSASKWRITVSSLRPGTTNAIRHPNSLCWFQILIAVMCARVDRDPAAGEGLNRARRAAAFTLIEILVAVTCSCSCWASSSR